MPEDTPRADVRVRVKGTINSMLSHAAESYKENHPDKEVRFAYAPENAKSKFSKVAMHRMRGYKPVTNEDAGLEEDEIYGASNEPPRVGDTILLAADKDRVEARRAELALAANRDANMSIDVYTESVERASAVGNKRVKAHGEAKRGYTEYEKLPQPEEKE